MTHGHFRGWLRFSFAEWKKPAIHIFFQSLRLLSFPMLFSLPCFLLEWRAYEFFPGGHLRWSRVTLKCSLKYLLLMCTASCFYH